MNNKTPKDILNPSFRLTKIRSEIIKCVSDKHHSHTFDDIVEHLKGCDKLLRINFASIYNTLNLLVSEGIILARIDNVTQKTNYEIMNSKSMHYHIYDIRTKKEMTHTLPNSIRDDLINILKIEKDDILNIDLNIIIKSKDK